MIYCIVLFLIKIHRMSNKVVKSGQAWKTDVFQLDSRATPALKDIAQTLLLNLSPCQLIDIICFLSPGLHQGDLHTGDRGLSAALQETPG